MSRYILVVLACAAIVAAQDVVPAAETLPTTVLSECGRVIEIRPEIALGPISRADQEAVNAYLCRHPGLVAKNYAFLARIFPVLIKTGVLDARDRCGVIILNQEPKWYFGLGQMVDWILRLRWKVCIPESPPLPPLPPAPPYCPPRPILLAPPCQPPRIGAPGQICLVTVQAPPPCAVPCYVPQAVCAAPGPLGFVPVQSVGQVNSTRAQTTERRLMSVGLGFMPTTQVNQSQSQSQSQGQSQTQGPVTCPPGQPPPPPPPAAASTCPPLVQSGVPTHTNPAGQTGPTPPTPQQAGG